MKHRLQYCKRCGTEMYHRRKRIRAKVGLIATVLTAGLFLPVWLFYVRWVCMECGHVKTS